jgi:mono/diheme cytochrome c family protein
MRARQRSRIALAAALAVALALGGGGPAAAQDPPTAKRLNKFNGKAEAIKEGRALYLKYGCSACHGVMGGGGMAPPISDDAWKFGSSDEVLYKLIKGQIPNATMPRMLGDQMTDDEIWKVIAYVRSVYVGDRGKVNW